LKTTGHIFNAKTKSFGGRMGRIVSYIPGSGISPAAGFIPTGNNSKHFILWRRRKISGNHKKLGVRN
jgi:hypothetical protein